MARRTASTRLSLTTGRVEMWLSSAASVRAVSETSMLEFVAVVSVLRPSEVVSRTRETGAPPPTCTGRPSIPLILFAIAQSPDLLRAINGARRANFRVADVYLALLQPDSVNSGRGHGHRSEVDAYDIRGFGHT